MCVQVTGLNNERKYTSSLFGYVVSPNPPTQLTTRWYLMSPNVMKYHLGQWVTMTMMSKGTQTIYLTPRHSLLTLRFFTPYSSIITPVCVSWVSDVHTHLFVITRNMIWNMSSGPTVSPTTGPVLRSKTNRSVDKTRPTPVLLTLNEKWGDDPHHVNVARILRTVMEMGRCPDRFQEDFNRVVPPRTVMKNR